MGRKLPEGSVKIFLYLRKFINTKRRKYRRVIQLREESLEKIQMVCLLHSGCPSVNPRLTRRVALPRGEPKSRGAGSWWFLTRPFLLPNFSGNEIDFIPPPAAS